MKHSDSVLQSKISPHLENLSQKINHSKMLQTQLLSIMAYMTLDIHRQEKTWNRLCYMLL